MLLTLVLRIVAEKSNVNTGFEKQIWDAACVLWGHIPAAEYRKVIVGLIFQALLRLNVRNRMLRKI